MFVKDGGRWKIAQIQGTLLQPERPAAPVSAALLDAYAGSYTGGDPGLLIIERTQERLVSRRNPSSVPPRVLTPASDSTFFDKLGNEYLLQRDGNATRLLIRRFLATESRFERRR